jgi:glycosyltransferase involved in cell wall biosynthesis
MATRLLINATMLNDPEIIGLGVYSYCMIRELLPKLAESDNFSEVRLIGDYERMQTHFGNQLRGGDFGVCDLRGRNPLSRLVGLHRAVARERRGGDTLLYSPTHHGVLFRTITQVITIHDLFPLLFPDNYRRQHYYFKYYLPRVLRRCQAVVTDSDNSARDIAEHYSPCPPVSSVSAGLRQDLEGVRPKVVSELEGLPFFLFVGPSFQHKNADRLIDAFAQLCDEPGFESHQLVFTGGRNRYLGYLKDYIAVRHRTAGDRIRFLGYVDREELAWLYDRAVANMITTLYEGFGLPALEAMHFGCPVVASRVASLPEVCGGAALFVDPADVGGIASSMRRISTDSALRSDLIDKGTANLKRFNWRTAAREVGDLLARLSRSD